MQVDLFSFGVVLWEIVSLQQAPCSDCSVILAYLMDVYEPLLRLIWQIVMWSKLLLEASAVAAGLRL